MTELPSDIAVERVWLVEATYAPDAAETRGPFRARHLARLADLRDAGVVIESGAFLDVSSSIMLLRAEDEAAALDVARADIYVASGIWVEIRARPFGRVVRTAGAAG